MNCEVIFDFDIFQIMKMINYKKVLLRERKRHTPSVVLTGYPPRQGTPLLTWPGRGVPYLGTPPAGYPLLTWPGGWGVVPYLGTPLAGYTPGRVPPILTWGVPYLGTPQQDTPWQGTPPWLDLAGYPPSWT